MGRDPGHAVRGKLSTCSVKVGGIGLLLLLVSVFATWPLITHMDRFLLVSDPFVSAWGLWWVEQAIVHLHNPWWTTYLLAPKGTYLSFHALVPLAGLVLAPLTALLGAGLTLNLTQLLLPPATAVAARLLGRELGLQSLAAWVGGGLYGFSTIVDWRTEFHLNFGFALPLLPLALIFAVRYTRTGRLRDAGMSGGIVGLAILTDPISSFLAAFGVALWVAVEVTRGRDWRKWLRFTAVGVVGALIVGAPQLAAMTRAATHGAYERNEAALATTWVSGETNVLTMLSPGNVRSIVPGNLQSLAYAHPWGEATPAYGWAALALTLCLAFVTLVLRRGPPPLPRSTVIWALVTFFLMSWLALGPQFRFGTFPHTPLGFTRDGQRVTLLMPFTWLTYVPLLGDIHAPSRFTLLGMLPLSMLAGAGFQQLRREGRLASAIAYALVLFGLLESGFPDGGAAKQWVPLTRAGLYAPITRDRTHSLVVDVPLGFVGSTAGAGEAANDMEPMLRATQHGHPVAEGYVTRLPQSLINDLVNVPLYAAILAEQSGQQTDVKPAVARSDATAIGARWVVVWPEANLAVRRYLMAIGYRTANIADGIRVMRLPRS